MRITAKVPQWMLPILVVGVISASLLATESTTKPMVGVEPQKLGRPKEGCQPCRMATELTRRATWRQADPLNVCELMFDLSEDQKELLNGLAAEHAIERSKRVREVDAQYAEKAKALLSREHRMQFSGVFEAVVKFRTALAEATAELAAVGGPGFASLAREGRITRGKGLLRFVDLTSEQQEELDVLNEQKTTAITEGRKATPVPADKTDTAAMSKYREAIKVLYAQADAQFEMDLAELLTDRQTAKLDKLEEALRRFETKKNEAQRTFRREVTKALAAQ